MTFLLPHGAVDLQALRVQLYDLLGQSYVAVSPSPGALLLLQAAGIVRSSSGYFRGQGRVRGTGFHGRRFCVQEISAHPQDDEGVGFDGVIISISHRLRIYGRTIVIPDRGALNPRHIDGMKRVGFPSREFEAQFEVYADDQVESRALIPPDFMERLMKFDPILEKGRASVAFAGRQMHVSLPTGSLLRISDDFPIYSLEAAAAHIAGEMSQIFDLVAQVDALQQTADRHCPVERAKARDDFYASAILSVPPAIEAALESGLIANVPKARHLTADAHLVDPAFRGLLMPRV